jgi:hypothetical protein
MEAPHLKQNIRTSINVAEIYLFCGCCCGKYFIQIEKAITDRSSEPLLSAEGRLSIKQIL